MKKKIGIALGIIFVICIILVIYNYYRLRTRNAVEKLITDKKMINILLAGSNVYHGNKHKFFAIISINPDNKNIGITFIPPSFRILLDENGKRVSRIDEIDFIDFSKIQNSFKKDLKLAVPFYIELYSPDVIRIVDLLEGVDLFILDQIKGWPNTHNGLNYFDGKKVIKYINSAEQNSIYLKFDRIQDILLTLYYNKETKNKLNNLMFIHEIMKTVRTNLLPQEVFKIGEIIFMEGNVISTILPGSFKNNYYVINDISYKIYEKEFLTSLVVSKKAEPIIKIKILNGTNVPRLARRMRNNLIRDGLNVVEFGTSPYTKMKESIIICRKGNYSAVNKVSELTGINRIYYIIDSTQLNNLLIIIGEDLVQ